MRYCGKCHTCGTELKKVLDGEEYCPVCEQYRRYFSHGWPGRHGGPSVCPSIPLKILLEQVVAANTDGEYRMSEDIGTVELVEGNRVFTIYSVTMDGMFVFCGMPREGGGYSFPCKEVEQVA